MDVQRLDRITRRHLLSGTTIPRQQHSRQWQDLRTVRGLQTDTRSGKDGVVGEQSGESCAEATLLASRQKPPGLFGV